MSAQIIQFRPRPGMFNVEALRALKEKVYEANKAIFHRPGALREENMRLFELYQSPSAPELVLVDFYLSQSLCGHGHVNPETYALEWTGYLPERFFLDKPVVLAGEKLR